MANLTDLTSETGRRTPELDTSKGTKNSRLAKLGIGALFLLFAVELGCCLWDWHRINHDRFLPAFLHSFVCLAFFWITLLLVVERFSRLVAWLELKVNWLAGFIGKIVAAMLVSLVWNIVIVSLVMRYSLGCYLNLSLLRFAYTNMTHGLFEHMVSFQRTMFVAMVAFLLLTTIWIFWKTFRSSTRLNLLGNDRLRRPVLYTWLALFTGFTLSM
ncbi:MAG: hypothetical protein JWQ71_3265, partial [Pedosphaera sp.]|nr:hypothetical protein [Pedosphaera sp.]